MGSIQFRSDPQIMHGPIGIESDWMPDSIWFPEISQVGSNKIELKVNFDPQKQLVVQLFLMKSKKDSWSDLMIQVDHIQCRSTRIWSSVDPFGSDLMIQVDHIQCRSTRIWSSVDPFGSDLMMIQVDHIQCRSTRIWDRSLDLVDDRPLDQDLIDDRPLDLDLALFPTADTSVSDQIYQTPIQQSLMYRRRPVVQQEAGDQVASRILDCPGSLWYGWLYSPVVDQSSFDGDPVLSGSLCCRLLHHLWSSGLGGMNPELDQLFGDLSARWRVILS